MIAEATVSLQLLLGVGTAVAAVVGIAVSFRLFMYRLDRLEKRADSAEQDRARTDGDVRRLELRFERKIGAGDRSSRRHSMTETDTFVRK